MVFRPQPSNCDTAAERDTQRRLTLVPPDVPVRPDIVEPFARASLRALAPMFGRDELIAEVADLVHTDDIRVVTITGPGGVGKTRLAIQLAERLDDAFRDGSVFVSLASVHDPHHVIPVIATALGLSETPSRPVGDELRRWMRTREILLVLDNLEQVLPCGPALAALLADAPGITLLVTSRAPLGISGEQRIVVPPLPVPDASAVDPAAIRSHASVRLFEDRAKRSDPRFAITAQNAETVAAICARLDGLPLALELAAARTTILSPAALLDRLSDRFRVLTSGTRDLPDRHRTMRRVIAWTYDLLPDTVQRMARMLAMFSDGWSLELLETLARTSGWSAWFGDAADAIDLLHELVDQSLVQVRMPVGGGEPRFLMLETVRAFGQEQALALGEDRMLRAVHLEAMVTFARQHAPQLDSADRDARQRWIDAEWENVRVAHAWAVGQGFPAQALRLASAVWHACEVKGQFAQGRAWHESAMAALGDDPLAPASPDDVPLRADEWLMARLTAAFLQEDCMDGDAAEPTFLAVRAEAMAADTADPWIATQATLGLGLVAQGRADLDTARTWFATAATMAREMGAGRLEAMAINLQGRIAFLRMDLDEAGAVFARARDIAVRIGDRRLEARYLNNLAVIARERNEISDAEELLEAVEATGAADGDPAFAANVQVNRAKIARAHGDLDVAEAEARAALARIAPLEMPGSEAFFFLDLAAVLLDRGAEGADAAYEAIATAIARGQELDDPALLAVALLHLPRLAMCWSRWTVAAETFDLADRVRTRIGMAWTPKERAEREPELARIGEKLPRGQTPASVFDPTLLAPDGTLDLPAVWGRVGVLMAILAMPADPGPPSEPDRRAFGLTPKETEVLALLGHGASTDEIATALSMSPRTATTHISRILGKLGVSSRAAAVAFAVRSGVV
ncbi:MAG: LuxR C-terminal-related transcriptional regulator [Thermomicrobiales bacterium]